MPSRSFISNFRFVMTLVATSVTFGAAYLYVCNLPRVKQWNTSVGPVIDCLEANLIAADEADLDLVLFMGSSRMHSCIDTELLSELDPTDSTIFLNLAQPGMGPWEADVVLRNVGHNLDRVKAVVIEVNPWTFSAHRRHPITGKPLKYPFEFTIWASAAERLSVDSLRSKVRLTASMVPRRPLREWWAILSHDSPAEAPRSLPRPAYHHDEGALAEIRHTEEFKTANIAPMHLHQYEFNQVKLDRFNALLTRLEAAGIAVIILHPPVAEGYFDYIDDDAARRAQFDIHEATMKSLARSHEVLYWKTASDCGLDESVFVDFGHFSREGSLAFSQRLFNELAPRFAAKVPPGDRILASGSVAEVHALVQPVRLTNAGDGAAAGPMHRDEISAQSHENTLDSPAYPR